MVGITFALILITPVSAEELTVTPVNNNRFKIKNELRKEIKELREENKEQKKNLIDNLKDKVQDFKDTLAKIINGEITANSGNTLTVNKDGKSYTINVNSNTLLKRHFWGNATMPEMSVGNKVNVWGKYANDAKTVIDARMIRNTSIMKRFGAFIGTVTSIDGNNFVINTVQRGVQTVTISPDTKLVNRKEQTITQSDIKVGHKIRVKGMWDQANKIITQVGHLKDFSLPAIPSQTVE